MIQQLIRHLFEHADAAPAYQFFNVVYEEAVGGYGDVVRFEDGAELARLFEVQQDFAFAGCAEEDGVEFFKQRGVGVVQGDLNSQRIGELDLDVFERLDVGDGELGGRLLFAAQDATDDDRDIDF